MKKSVIFTGKEVGEALLDYCKMRKNMSFYSKQPVRLDLNVDESGGDFTISLEIEIEKDESNTSPK